MLQKYYVAPNGVNTEFHAVGSIQYTAPDAFLTVRVLSFATLDELRDGQSPRWAQPIVMPIDAVGAPLIDSIEQWLASDPASLYAGGAVSVLAAEDLESAKKDRQVAIKAARDRAMYAGFEFNGMRFDSDVQAQVFVLGAGMKAMFAMQTGTALSIEFTLQDFDTHTLTTPEEAIGLGMAMGEHITATLDLGRELREAIDAAETIEAVQAVTWPN